MTRSEDGPRPTLIRLLAFAVSGTVGLLFANSSPLGILVGGAAWGLLAPTLRRGVAYGTAFGTVVLGAFAVDLVTSGAHAGYSATGPIAAVPIIVALLFGGIGGLARGLR